MIVIQSMEAEQLFKKASNHFQANQYQQGLQAINQCVELFPKNTTLYSNRALFHSQLGNNDQAVEDLHQAIAANYLNYVAYFNLFSLQYNSGLIEDAFDNLCCSLSCLYLIRGRKVRRELDVQRAIKYADNNPEAHILKSLMYLQDGKNKLALNQIEWVLDLHIHTPLCLKIKNIVDRKLNPYARSEIIPDDEETVNYRLHTTYQPSQGYEEEIKERVKEFNLLYDEIVGSDFGAIMQKVPRIKKESSRVQQEQLNEVNGIYEVKYKEQSPIKYSKERYSQAPTKEHLPYEINESDTPQRNNEETSLDLVNPVENDIANQFDQENLLDQEPKYEQNDHPQKEPLLLEEQNLLFDLQPAVEQPKPSSINQGASEVSSTSEPVNLYPIQKKKKIQFTVISAQVKNPKSSLKDVYIIGNYNSKKGQRIKTPNKRLQNGYVEWFTSTPPTNISQTQQTVNVKLYNKEYFAYEDELIGQGEVEVVRSGEIKFPMYQKNKVSSYITMRIDVI